jgi:hypothetical protein
MRMSRNLGPVNMRFRRRYLAIPVFLLVLTPVLAVGFDAATRPTSPKIASTPSPHCQKGDLLGDAHNPLRFRILSNCESASGVVKSIALQDDGDQLIGVALDSQYTRLLGSGNISYKNDSLVLDLTPQELAIFSVPLVGQHITFVGPLVYDTENQWNAIYPVWSIRAD